ncbi:hypothetical protein VUR80DRAFT_3609 [Thermomyces stellatus]
MQCCNECICGDCLAPAITSSIEDNFMVEPHEDAFIYCPISTCNGAPNIGSEADFRELYLHAKSAAPNLSVADMHTAYRVQQALQRAGVSRHVLTDTEDGSEEEIEFARVNSGQEGRP